MTRPGRRGLHITGVLCLLGQGTLIFVGGAGQRIPHLALPGLFLLFSLGLSLSFALAMRQGRGSLLRGGLLFLAVGTMLATNLGLMAMGGKNAPEGAAGQTPESLAQVREMLERIPLVAEPILAQAGAQLDEQEFSRNKGDLFRTLQPLPIQWEEGLPEAEDFPARFILWQDGLPLAWTYEALPLLSPTGVVEGAALWREYWQYHENWFLRHFLALENNLVLEMQIPLPVDPSGDFLDQVQLVVGPVDQAPVLVGEDGRAKAAAALQESSGGLAIIPVAADWDDQRQLESRSTGLLMLLVTAWALTAVGLLRLFFRWPGFLLGVWVGRGLLAAVDFFRWTGVAFPDQADPAAPDQLISLVGPAYFATPFAWGWFASTADALLTAIVVSLTAWNLLRSLGLVGTSQHLVGENQATSKAKFHPGQGVLGGLVFGLVATVMLLGLRELSALLAQNANPRLIGRGVSLGFLSFWSLHIVLMMIPFSLMALVTGWAAASHWPAREKMAGWLGGAGLAAMVSAGLSLAMPDHWRGLPPVAALVVVALWLLAPAFRSRPRFLRRFAWPAVLLLAVAWNYISLREVYDQAERGWLERKGQLITSSGENWTRFLLEDALLGMREADEPTQERSPAGGIWQDEPAYRLWQSSALGDLGYSCFVEIMDDEGISESIFGTGFMGDTQYEILEQSMWTDTRGEVVADGWEMRFQAERRAYPGGEEEVLMAEVVRWDGLGLIRVELPTRSRRVSTLLADLTQGGGTTRGGYQPRSEVDRPVLLVRGDDSGWLGTGNPGFELESTEKLMAQLKSGQRPWANLHRGERTWLCRWHSLPDGEAQSPGEGFLLGLLQSNLSENLLDLSRLMLLDLVLLFALFLLVQGWYRIDGGLVGQGGLVTGLTSDPAPKERKSWLPGFQEKFLAGYLLLGMLLLLVVGTSVDKVGYDRVRGEARDQTRQGLSLAVGQLRALMVEQARSLASSEYIADLLVGQLEGRRPAGPLNLRQGMVFTADGRLLLDETLSNLNTREAAALLAAGRENPLLVIEDDGEVFVATVIPIQLGDVFTAEGGPSQDRGFFLYRQRFDQGLLVGLADLARGQATLRLEGQPRLASHPAPVFSGEAALLADPLLMASLLDHPGGPAVFPQSSRPFAFLGAQPLPLFARDEMGQLIRRPLPAVLSLGFPDREIEYAGQRRETGLFLAGLANLILLTALFLALLMSWNLFRPLRLLLTATRSLAKGDFSAPLPEKGGDEVGRLTDAFGSMRSELHSARERLAAREQFLTTVLDQVTVGVAVLDDNGVVAALNPAGRNILADFHAQMDEVTAAKKLLAEVRDLAGAEDRWAGELRSLDGRHTIRLATAPLELSGGHVNSMLVFEDITEFLHTKKMAINAELARQVAHEVKNPLTPIQLSVQLLEQAWRDEHPQLDRIVGDTVARVLEQVELLRSIASEFSLLGRPGDLDLVPLDLKLLTNQVVDAYRGGLAEEMGNFRFEVADQELPQVLGETDSLQKILGNLMQNSLDAARPEEPLQVQVSWECTPRDVSLVWTDNGEGLTFQVAEKLFDPYFSTKSKGTGLGLAICRNLADRMGGRITLTNRSDGQGSRAVLTLPLAPAGNNQD